MLLEETAAQGLGEDVRGVELYKDKLLELPNVKSSQQVREIYNDMQSCRDDLNGTAREITDAAFIADLTENLSDANHDIKVDIRDGMRDLTADAKKDPVKVVAMLEGVMASYVLAQSRQQEREERTAFNVRPAERATQDIDPDKIAELAAALGVRLDKTGDAPCDACGVRHPGNPDTCHAYLLSQGKSVPNWDKKSADTKARITSRSEDIKRLGMYKDRADTKAKAARAGGGGGKAALLATLLAGQFQGAHMMPIVVSPLVASARPRAPVTTGVHSLVMDSGNLAGAHLICDKNLFTTFDPNAPAVPIMVANQVVDWTQGSGDCDVLAVGPDDSPLGRFTLRGCQYAPSFGVNLVSVQSAWANEVAIRFEDHNHIAFPDGMVIPFDERTYSLRVIPVHDVASAILTRGKRGQTSVDGDTKSERWHTRMQLWSARLNVTF